MPLQAVDLSGVTGDEEALREVVGNENASMSGASMAKVAAEDFGAEGVSLWKPRAKKFDEERSRYQDTGRWFRYD